MEKTIQTLIYIHAGLGALALLAGFISLVAKKGMFIHKKSGLVFFYAMMSSALTALVIAVSPGHQNPFLFAIGIFSLYFVLTGKRALRFKKKNPCLLIDRWISASMIITGILMILLPILISNRLNIVLLIFGLVGILFSVRDLLTFKRPERLRMIWLKLHLGKTIGGYIAATTAFVVVNEFFPGFYGWFVPSIIGGFIIIYWIRKINKKTTKSV